MAVNDLDLTVAGWVGTDPRHYPGRDGHVPYTQFRLARRRWVFDREQSTHVDGGTDWFTVKVFRDTAMNVAESVRRGDPVVVKGRLQLDAWTPTDGQERTTAVLVASALGHNLELGTTRFVRTVRGSGGGGGEGPVGERSAVPVDADVLGHAPDDPDLLALGPVGPVGPDDPDVAGREPLDLTGAVELVDEPLGVTGV
ncbi:MAG TPA: single-stranded DNA-binding protein [Cellulomonas sp.]